MTCKVSTPEAGRARRGYLRRAAAVMLCCVLVFALVRPPRARAVALVDDALVIGLVVLGSLGVVYLSNSAQESGAADYIATKFDEYLNATGKAVSSFVDTVASFWYDQYQQIHLSAQQTKEWLDFARYLSSASAGDVEILDNRIVLDGLPIYYGSIWNLPPLGSFPPSISVQVGLDLNWEVAPFPSYPGLKLRCIQMVHPTIGEIRPYLEVSCDGVSSRGFHNSSTSRSVDCWFSYDKDKNEAYFFCDSDRWITFHLVLSPEFSAYLHGLVGGTTTSVVDASNVDFGFADSLAAEDIVTVPGTWTADDVLTGVQEGTLVVPHAVANAGTVVGDLPLEGVDVPGLGALFTTRFPFSIPWDMVRAVKLLSAPPVVPHWEVDFLAPLANRVGGWEGSTKIVLDFSDYEILGALCRWVSTILFCAALISGTKKLIWS